MGHIYLMHCACCKMTSVRAKAELPEPSENITVFSMEDIKKATTQVDESAGVVVLQKQTVDPKEPIQHEEQNSRKR